MQRACLAGISQLYGSSDQQSGTLPGLGLRRSSVFPCTFCLRDAQGWKEGTGLLFTSYSSLPSPTTHRRLCSFASNRPRPVMVTALPSAIWSVITSSVPWRASRTYRWASLQGPLRRATLSISCGLLRPKVAQQPCSRASGAHRMTIRLAACRCGSARRRVTETARYDIAICRMGMGYRGIPCQAF